MNPGAGSPALRMSGIRCSFAKAGEVVRGVTLEIARGEKVALIGPNGAGKTTLLLAAAGLVDHEGEVFVAGERFTRTTASRIRRKIGFLFQNPGDQLFARTVHEDVSLVPRRLRLPASEVEGRTEAALRAMDLMELGDRSPHGLSVGEKKRVAIAGIMAARPEILLMDEPAGGLDPAQRLKLLSFFRAAEKTIFFATHDMDFARETATRCILLSKGRIVAEGPASSLLEDEVLLRQHGLALAYWYKGKRAAMEGN